MLPVCFMICWLQSQMANFSRPRLCLQEMGVDLPRSILAETVW